MSVKNYSQNDFEIQTIIHTEYEQLLSEKMDQLV